jgi:hypothetical protein
MESGSARPITTRKERDGRKFGDRDSQSKLAGGAGAAEPTGAVDLAGVRGRRGSGRRRAGYNQRRAGGGDGAGRLWQPECPSAPRGQQPRGETMGPSGRRGDGRGGEGAYGFHFARRARWPPLVEEADATAMRVRAEGDENGARKEGIARG